MLAGKKREEPDKELIKKCIQKIVNDLHVKLEANHKTTSVASDSSPEVIRGNRYNGGLIYRANFCFNDLN